MEKPTYLAVRIHVICSFVIPWLRDIPVSRSRRFSLCPFHRYCPLSPSTPTLKWSPQPIFSLIANSYMFSDPVPPRSCRGPSSLHCGLRGLLSSSFLPGTPVSTSGLVHEGSWFAIFARFDSIHSDAGAHSSYLSAGGRCWRHCPLPSRS